MTQFPDHTERARLALEALEPQLAAAELSLWRARSRLFARVSHPGSLLEGESYDVDTNAATFTSTMRGETAAHGPLQVIGTQYGTWLWSWCNPSVPGAASYEIERAVAADDALAEIRTCEKFEASEDTCERLAQFVATRAGWLGAYPAPYGDTLVFLALKLTPYLEHSVEPKDNLWCSYCGRVPHQVEHVLRVDDDCAICSACVERFSEILVENGSPEVGLVEGTPPCLICGGKEKRIFSEWGAACVDCIELGQNALRGQ